MEQTINVSFGYTNGKLDTDFVAIQFSDDTMKVYKAYDVKQEDELKKVYIPNIEVK